MKRNGIKPVTTIYFNTSNLSDLITYLYQPVGVRYEVLIEDIDAYVHAFVYL